MKLWIQSRRSARSAFTLIELLVVVSIIALLIAILLPSLAKARRQAKGVVCESNQRSLMMAVYLYAETNRGHFPTAGASHEGEDDHGEEGWIVQLADDYGKDTAIARCPMDESPAWTTPDPDDGHLRETSFATTAFLAFEIDGRGPYDRFEIIKRPSTTIFWVELVEQGEHAFLDHVDPDEWWMGEPAEIAAEEMQLRRHDGRENYAFVDGHVERAKFETTYKVDSAASDPPKFLRNKYDPLIGN
jgi:prepilin-type N-terminal cleavage/methylation domain-containing protein/prepilin-type processing-associated H-X9-DG protein